MEPEEKYAALVGQLGLPPPSPADSDQCALRLEGDLHVELWLAQTTQCLWITVDLGTIPSDRRNALYPVLLKCNLLMPEDRNDHFALDSSAHVLLCRTLNLAGIDVDPMVQQVFDAGDQARAWQRLLSQKGLICLH